jgi:hypothetical protein
MSTVIAGSMLDSDTLSAADAMQRIDTLLTHVWMVRTFLKHSDEAAEDAELRDVHHGLYDYMLALGAPLEANDAEQYLRLARKKYSKLRDTLALFREIQPEISSHTNFKMAVASLSASVEEIGKVLDRIRS